MIKQENVHKHKKVYVITFYDGYIDGCKYDIQELVTEYMSFFASYGTNYYKTAKEAEGLCSELNKAQLKKAEAKKRGNNEKA